VSTSGSGELTPVGRAEIVEHLGVSARTVDGWRRRGEFIEPRWVVDGRPTWALADVEAWAEQRRAQAGGWSAEAIVAAYNRGQSINGLVRAGAGSFEAIRAHLVASGVEIRPHGRAPRPSSFP